ncbi:3-keto-5-aminohexanoate cleavage protein [Methylobacterium isbiliense]|uniref:3-keto-5-aminohexanoate cleavage enzyme n=1 Tax=Methylobacterium isbiliense TaxID=315478 RepID=A0ABQ4SH12_9HYPH|nr:3-keto-5-aminohexanoate cleavage protein [Methylobacterium isbiliense]MDN3625368.1 3-keto-5-aminohexanoate cleavage protein [Methylobacterium isbiliense]GJE01074.1 3-keto-5-aminohexanoate cleavage enzyme [Methylobacterium isbiliense]
MTKPLIIMVAPNGARRTKADHPALPIAPRELGLDAARCREAGAAMIHLHVRDAEERHSLDVDRYRAAIAAVRREAGAEMIVQVTTESVGLFSPAEQMAAMRALRPEAFSVAVRELFVEPDDEAEAGAFLAEQARAGTLVQHILYDAGDVTRFQGLAARGLIPLERASVLFVLGRYSTGQRSEPADLLPFLAAWNSGHHLDLPWSLCAFGPREAACLIAAATLGGDARVGFENNLWRPDGSLASDNAAQVADLAALARGLGLTVADPATARALLAA